MKHFVIVNAHFNGKCEKRDGIKKTKIRRFYQSHGIFFRCHHDFVTARNGVECMQQLADVVFGIRVVVVKTIGCHMRTNEFQMVCKMLRTGNAAESNRAVGFAGFYCLGFFIDGDKVAIVQVREKQPLLRLQFQMCGNAFFFRHR